MAETKQQQEVDPRHRLAQKYMQRAHQDLAAKEAEKPASQRERPRHLQGKPTLADLRPSISSSTLMHGMLLMLVITAVALASTVNYLMLNMAFLVGRAIALPVGILIFIGLSYASALYLGIVESTANGHTEPDSQLLGDWRDWFWTMPASWGILLASAGIGWLVSRVIPGSTATTISLTIWLAYPILQLSTLETGSPAGMISPPILKSLVGRPVAWIAFLAFSFALWHTIGWVAAATWRDPPFLTMLLMGPFVTLIFLIYAWSLGQLARWIAFDTR
ncbi:MAG: hypothetical protein AAGD11_11080 [Planctomycetota bacterium]